MRARAIHLLKCAAICLIAGVGYALFVRLTGVGIPCPILAVTGLYCPGCGISRFCLALLRLDFAAALRSNMALFVILPPALVVLVAYVVKYIRTGQRKLAAWQSVLIWVMIAVLLVFGILRNLPAFAFLAPQ